MFDSYYSKWGFDFKVSLQIMDLKKEICHISKF